MTISVFSFSTPFYIPTQVGTRRVSLSHVPLSVLQSYLSWFYLPHTVCERVQKNLCCVLLCPFLLQWSMVVATITEIPPLMFLPNFLVQRKVLRPLRTQTGGTIMVSVSGNNFTCTPSSYCPPSFNGIEEIEIMFVAYNFKKKGGSTAVSVAAFIK